MHSLLQYYEKLTPTIAPESSAAASADIAAALASEVAELKQQDGKLFAYHSTGVSGLAYITMRDDAGNSPLPAPPCPAHPYPLLLSAASTAGAVAWQVLC